MSRPKDWPHDQAPPEAYYNHGKCTSVEEYEEARKKDKDACIISWSSKYMRLWDMLMTNQFFGMPIIPPPPLYVDRSDDVPYVISPQTGEKLMVSGHMLESWTSGNDDIGNLLMGRVFHQLRIYEKVVKKEVNTVCGKTPTTLAAIAVLDRLLLHEMAHYIINTIYWMHCYDDSPDPYKVSVEKLKAYVDGMGGEQNEQETEALGLMLFRQYYFPCCNGKLTPQLEDFTWPEFYCRRHPGYKDGLLVHKYYVLSWKLDHEELSQDEYRRVWLERASINAKLKKHGKKDGRNLVLIS